MNIRLPIAHRSLTVLALFLVGLAGSRLTAGEQYGADVTPDTQWSNEAFADYGADTAPGAFRSGRIQPSYGLDVPPHSKFFPTPQDAYHAWSGAVHQTHARDEARLLKWYTSCDSSPASNVARGHAEMIRKEIEAARHDYEGLSPKMSEDPTVAKHLKTIQKHLSEAIQVSDRLDQECAKGTCDAKSVAGCCTEIDRALKSANLEQLKLLQHFAPKQKPEGDGVPAKQDNPKHNAREN